MPIDKDKLSSSDIDTSPTIELPALVRMRFSDMAKELEQARVQGYIEANIAKKLLDLVQDILPLIM